MNFKNNSRLIPIIFSSSLLIALVWAYWPVLNNLIAKLLTDEDYSFGLLLPLVSGYIVFLKWPQIRREAWRPSWMGLVVLALGMAFYIFGELSTDVYSPALSFVVSLSGLLFIVGGWKLFRLLAFPLLLLVFMIPLPGFLIRQCTLPLQLLSSRLSTEMLQMIGVAAVRQGNVIDLGIRQLQVVAACSGLRYILALLALGIIFCYFYQRRLWKAAILIIAVIPAAIFANALRVAGMGIYPALQEGFWHGFSGWLIFVFCFGFLFLVNYILTFREPETQGPACKEPPGEETSLDSLKPSYFPLIVALILVIVAGHFGLKLGNIPPVPLLQSFDNFPMQLGPWQGRRSYIDPAMFKATGASAYFEAEFVDPSQSPVSLWVAYYENQKGGGSVHSPFTCLTGGGWELIDSGITKVAPGLPARFMVMEQGGSKHLIYYWYLQRGRWLTSEYLNKFYLSYDGLLNRRADGALVRIITPSGPDIKLAHERLHTFAKLLVPVLPQFISR